MTPTRYAAISNLPTDIHESFAYHERPGCLQRLTPPWESLAVESSDDSLAEGSRVVLKTSLFGVPLRWAAKHTVYNPPHEFADIAESGPFHSWHHRHRFESLGPSTSRLTDEIDYVLPGGRWGHFFGHGIARGKIESMFAYRHRITRDDLALAAKYPGPRQTVAVSGATGLVGMSLSSLLTLLGHRVLPIVRSATADGGSIAAWGEDSESSKFDDVDVVVHLAGKSIASARWSDAVKQEIRDSRVIRTRQLCDRLAARPSPPKVLICASATGIYGDRGDETLTESSASGNDFLAGVAQEWEDACQPARDAGIRVVHARFGIIMAPGGGALQKMLLPAKAFGGSLGNGRQWWSWIGLDDVVGGIVHAMHSDSLSGPVNFVTPQPLINRDVAATLARVLGRYPLLPAPALGLRLALGEMADALLLSSTRVMPTQLVQSGYEFRFSDLESLLRYCLGKNRKESSA